MELGFRVKFDSEDLSNITYQYEAILDHLNESESSGGRTLVIRTSHSDKDIARDNLLSEIENIESQLPILKNALANL